jgi:hypothetical protein
MRILIILSLIIGTIGIYSCDPFYDCVKVDNLEVFDNLRNVDSVVYFSENINITEAAFDSLFSEMKIFVNSDSAYQVMKDLADDNDCETCIFPNLNFDKYSLIGRFFQIQCDQFSSQRFVATSDSTYAFYNKFINDRQCSSSSCPNSTFNWMLVPKIESIDQVEFIFGNSYYDCDC